MGRTRLFLAAGALALLVLAAGAMAYWGATTHAGPASVRVEVVGPAGSLFNGTVTVENATAYDALRATRLPLQVESYPGMGLYVRAIGPYAAHGGAGWVYEVDHGGGWVSGDRSAASYALSPGDTLRWRWADG